MTAQGTVIYINKYWNDNSIESGTTSSSWGGRAWVRYTDLDDLGMKCDTGGGYQQAKAVITINGAHQDSAGWTFPGTQWYNWRVYWYLEGKYEHASNNYFKFEYTLFYLEGDTRNSVDTYTKQYTSTIDWPGTTVNHFGGAVYLHSTKTYYLECIITLRHYKSDKISNFLESGNEIDFTKVVFSYNTGPY
jgi:hypothetical protein